MQPPSRIKISMLDEGHMMPTLQCACKRQRVEAARIRVLPSESRVAESSHLAGGKQSKAHSRVHKSLRWQVLAAHREPPAGARWWWRPPGRRHFEEPILSEEKVDEYSVVVVKRVTFVSRLLHLGDQLDSPVLKPCPQVAFHGLTYVILHAVEFKRRGDV